MLITNIPLYTPFPLPLSIFKLHYSNKGQVRTLFAKLAHCSFKTLGVLELFYFSFFLGGGSEKFPSPLLSF